jgi:hypothetical protein
VDSLSAIVYPILGGQRNAAGHVALAELSTRLHRLARRHGIAVLVTNGSVAADAEGGAGAEEAGEEAYAPLQQRPALGLTWSFAPDVSLLVLKQLAPCSGSGGAWRLWVTAAVLKSTRLFLGCPEAAATGPAPADETAHARQALRALLQAAGLTADDEGIQAASLLDGWRGRASRDLVPHALVLPHWN